MASTSETGLQLFARLIPRPSLIGLDGVLFPDGPGPKDLIELSGETSCGKTLLFTQFIAKCILPKEWKNTTIGGLQAGVVLLNTDHHFQVYKLMSMLESRVRAVNRSVTVSEVEHIIKDSLERFIIYNVFDSVQLQVTFYALQTLVSNQPEIGLILLDSVCAFYWQDAMATGIRKMDLYSKTVIKVLQKSLGDFKGVIMYSRPSYFHSKSTKAGMSTSEPQLGFVSQRIELKRASHEQNVFCAYVETNSGKFERTFIIDTSGIQWSE